MLETASADEARAVIRQNPDLDLVLLDLGLPGAGGMSLLEDLRRDDDGVPVAVISETDDRVLIRRALDLGAMGYIPKTAWLEVLLEAVRLMLAGDTYIPKQALAESLRRDAVRLLKCFGDETGRSVEEVDEDAFTARLSHSISHGTFIPSLAGTPVGEAALLAALIRSSRMVGTMAAIREWVDLRAHE